MLERNDKMKLLKNCKRATALLMAGMMCVMSQNGMTGNVLLTSMITAEAADYSYGDWEYNLLEDGTVEIAGYKGEETELEIPGEIDGKSVTNIRNYAFVGYKNLISITIPKSVQNIGYSAFWCCSKLTSVTIPEGVMSIKDGTFEDCSSLSSIEIPKSVTSIGNRAFDGCSSLTSIAISENVKYIGSGAFEGCNNLINIQVSEINNYYASDEGVLFNKDINKLIHCPAKKEGEYIIPKGVTSINSCAFRECSNLTEIIIPEGVICIGDYTFDGCSSLSSIEIPQSVTSIGGSAFTRCSNLTSIHVSENNCNFSSVDGVLFNKGITELIKCPSKIKGEYIIPEDVKSIAECGFEGCSSLTSIAIPSGVISIEGHTFLDCSSLSSIEIPQSITSIGYGAFEGCSSLTSIEIPEGVMSIEDWAFEGCSSLTSITIPENVTNIGIYTFRGCSSLTSIVLPESIAKIELGAFEGCSSLTSIEIPCGVISIEGYAFSGCSSLTSITIPESVTEIGYNTFAKCSSLTSITIPESVTTISLDAFDNSIIISSTRDAYAHTYAVENNIKWELLKDISDCILDDWECNLLEDGTLEIVGYTGDETKIVVPGEIDGKKVVSIGRQAFYGCKRLVSVTVTEGATNIGEYSFVGCSNLTSVIIPKSVTDISWNAFDDNITIYSTKDAYAYEYALENDLKWISIDDLINWEYNLLEEGTVEITRYKGLESDVKIPSEIAGKRVTKIGSSAFSFCSGLTSVIVPEGIDSIGEKAFIGCSGLTSITIANSIISINNYAFYGCSGLTNITIPEGVANIDCTAFVNCRNLTSIQVAENNNYYVSLDGVLFNKDITRLICCPEKKQGEYVIPEGIKLIGSHAFDGCKNLTKITIPNGVNVIEEYGFAGCSCLNCIVIPQGVKNIDEYAFFGCIKLDSITIPESVTEIGNCAFEECGNLTIYSTDSAYAHTYAVDNNINWKSLSELSDSGSRDIVSATVTLSDTSFVFDGTGQKPSVSVSYGTEILVNGTDYTVEYSNNRNVGTATIIISGIGNYSGSITESYSIYPASIIDVTLSEEEFLYNGEAQIPQVVVSSANKTLNEESDYTIAFTNNIEPGIATVTVTGKGNYTGIITKTYTIYKRQVYTMELSCTTYVYDGSEKRPSVTLKDRFGNEFDENDYTVDYMDNIDAGTATVLVDMKGNYEGSYAMNFDINKAEAKSLELKEESYIYDGTEKKPLVTVKDEFGKEIDATNYTVEYIDNVNAGTATVNVTMSKNYNGTFTENFIINKVSNKITSTSSYNKNASSKAQSFNLNVKAKGGKLTYKSNSKSVSVNSVGKVTIAKNYSGKAIVTITAGDANYKTVTKTVTIIVKPEAIKVTSVKNSSSRKAIAKWSKLSYVSGYQIQYGLKSSFKGAKTITVNGASRINKVLTGLTKGKTYYVRLRTYKTVGSTKLYSEWSGKKRVKILR